MYRPCWSLLNGMHSITTAKLNRKLNNKTKSCGREWHVPSKTANKYTKCGGSFSAVVVAADGKLIMPLQRSPSHEQFHVIPTLFVSVGQSRLLYTWPQLRITVRNYKYKLMRRLKLRSISEKKSILAMLLLVSLMVWLRPQIITEGRHPTRLSGCAL